MKEIFFAIVVTVFAGVNIWLVDVQAKKVDEVFERTRMLNDYLDRLSDGVRELNCNPAVQKGKREAEIQQLKSKLDSLEKEKDSDVEKRNESEPNNSFRHF